MLARQTGMLRQHFRDRAETVLESVGFDIDSLAHGQQQVTQSRVVIDRPRANAIVGIRVCHVVLTDLRQVEIDVLTMLIAQCTATGKDCWQVRIAMTVPIGHAASPENLSRVQQRTTVLLVCLELVKEVAELLNQESVRLR